MPCDYSVDVEHRLVHVTYEGEVGTRDVLTLLDRLEAEEAYAPNYDELIDLSGLECTRMSPEDLSRLTDLMFSLHLRAGRQKAIAIIAPHAEARGFAEAIAHSLARHPRLAPCVTTSRVVALQHLGIPADAVRA